MGETVTVLNLGNVFITLPNLNLILNLKRLMHMDYSLTTVFHATKSWKQNTKAIINNYREKEKKSGFTENK